ncbi:HAD family hydrolase [Leptolyngbya sp. PCC 6406]|uniref:HAD family hydrolase n=1 Tax=Leptolyngbya sp. PCC 6406 TaxID=1173264 RepID=UPI0002ACA4A8|nr:HAD family hydrolase [Leptolyngbya sp. PCC 6406]
MAPVQLVVFDMAGTTVQDQREVEACFMAAAEKTGLVADPAQVNAMMGLPKRRVFETLWDQQLGQRDEAQVDQSYQIFRGILEAHYQTQPVVPTAHCLEVFDWLHSRGIAIGLNTGFYREVTDIILDRLGWLQGLNGDHVGGVDSPIQVSVTPSEIYRQEGRPAPYMIQKAMYQLGITDPQRVVAVGDTPSDLAAGINAHCRLALGVTNGTHTRAELAAHAHQGLLASLAELPGMLKDY